MYMSDSITHTCIRPGCGTKYQSNEPEAYYCEPCNEARKAVAQEIDSKMLGKPREPIMTPLQAYDAAPKIRGFMKA